MDQRFNQLTTQFQQMKEHLDSIQEPPSFDELFQCLENHLSNIPVGVKRRGKKTIKMLDKVTPQEMLAFVKDCILRGNEPMIVLNER